MKRLIPKVTFWLALICPFIGMFAAIAIKNEPQPVNFLQALASVVGLAAAKVMLFISFYCASVLLALTSLVASLIQKDRGYVWASLVLVLFLFIDIVLSFTLESYIPLLLRFVS